MLTARASVPGVQRAAAAAGRRGGLAAATLDQPLAVALVGAHRLPRLLADVVAASLPAATDPGQVVLLPSRRDFAVQGVTSSDLPRQLDPGRSAATCATGYRTGIGPEPSGEGFGGLEGSSDDRPLPRRARPVTAAAQLSRRPDPRAPRPGPSSPATAAAPHVPGPAARRAHPACPPVHVHRTTSRKGITS